MVQVRGNDGQVRMVAVEVGRRENDVRNIKKVKLIVLVNS